MCIIACIINIVIYINIIYTYINTLQCVMPARVDLYIYVAILIKLHKYHVHN